MADMLTPNQSPFPSAPGNNPVTFMDVTHLSQIDEMTAVGPEFLDQFAPYTPQGPVNSLMALRSRFPFLPILPFPSMVRSFNLAAGVATDLQIPPAMALGMFAGDAGYWVSRSGRAVVPVTGVANGDIGGSQSIYSPDGLYFYLNGITEFSLISTAGANVSLMLWAINELPE